MLTSVIEGPKTETVSHFYLFSFYQSVSVSDVKRTKAVLLKMQAIYRVVQSRDDKEVRLAREDAAHTRACVRRVTQRHIHRVDDI